MIMMYKQASRENEYIEIFSISCYDCEQGEREIKMTVGMNVNSILDPRRCWKEWIRLGSLNKVRNLFEGEGLRNPATMRVPTISAIEKAAYRWAMDNQEEAKQDLSYAWQSEGVMMTEEMWRDFLIKKSTLAYFVQPRRIQLFLEQNELV